MTDNPAIKSLDINESLVRYKEELENYLLLTTNIAIEKATQINEIDLAAITKEWMSDIRDMENFLK